MDELGKILRKRREELDLSIEDVQARLKFTKKAILDLEENTKQNFNDPLFFNLYLKKYAELLELDFEKLVDYYDVFERTQTVKLNPNEVKKYNRKVKIRTSFWMKNLSKIIMLALTIIVVFCIWLFISKTEIDLFKGGETQTNKYEIPDDELDSNENNNQNNDSDPGDEVNNPDSNVGPDAKLVFGENTIDGYKYYSEHIENMQLKFVFKGECWVGVYDANGTELTSFLESTGGVTYDVELDYVKINVGKYANVDVYVNDILLEYQNHNSDSYRIILEKR